MTTTGSGEGNPGGKPGKGKDEIDAIVKALGAVIEKLRKPGMTFREERAALFLEGVKATIVAWCHCRDPQGVVQSYYEYPEYE